MQSLPGNAAVGQDNNTLRPLVEAAFRYRRLWVLSVLGLVMLTLLYTVLMPRQYSSEMDILVQNRRGVDQITPQRTTGTMMIDDVTEEQINSEIQVLRSRSLANIVVDPKWNSNSAHTMSADQLRAHDKAVARFYKHLSVEMVRKSNVISVTYTASDPHVASDTLNGLLTAFMAKQREIGQSPGAAQFFAAQAAQYKTQLDAAQNQLAAFQQKQQIVSLPDTEQTLNNEITQAQVELRSTDAQISQLSQQIGAQTRQLHSVPTRQATLNRVVPNQYSVEQLDTMLAQLQNQRTSLLVKFTPQDRFVQEIDRKIADTKAALKDAQSMQSEERSTDINPVWQQLTGSIVQNQDDRQGLKARHDALTQQISQLQSQLANVEGSTVEFSSLRQKVSELESGYQLYTQKRDEAMMSNAMDVDRLLNVAVAQAPTFAITPERPKPLVDLVLGSFTAIFLASFLVFFAEMGRSTIATPRELDRASRYPVLATIPDDRLLNNSEGIDRSSDSARLSLSFAPGPLGQKAGLNPAFERSREEPQAS